MPFSQINVFNLPPSITHLMVRQKSLPSQHKGYLFENLVLIDERNKLRLCTHVIGGSPSRKFLRFNTIVFRKDKWGIILKIIICTLKIRVLWGRRVVPMCRIRGR